MDLDAGGIVRHARLAYGGVAAMPARARKTRAGAARPAVVRGDASKRSCRCCKAEFTPISDLRGSAEYRRALITSLFEKFYFEADSRADGAAACSAARSEPPYVGCYAGSGCARRRTRARTSM